MTTQPLAQQEFDAPSQLGIGVAALESQISGLTCSLPLVSLLPSAVVGIIPGIDDERSQTFLPPWIGPTTVLGRASERSAAASIGRIRKRENLAAQE